VTAPALAPTLMPAPAYRRSWLAGALRERAGYGLFKTLLKQLAPGIYARLADRSWARCYVALLRHLETLFPVYDLWSDDDDEMVEIILRGDEGPWEGIPVYVMGVDIEELPDSPALLRCMAEAYYDPVAFMHDTPLHDYVENGTIPPLGGKPARHSRLIAPPRGRKWLEPWNHLPYLWLYATGQSGNPFLDYSNTYLQETRLPDWHVDEIRELARLWKDAEPLLERMRILRDYIDERPRERLPLLDGAIRGDRQAVEQITYPARRR
jgi:hypothetical protein